MQTATGDHRFPRQEKQDGDAAGRMHNQRPAGGSGREGEGDPAGEKRNREEPEQRQVGLCSKPDRRISTRWHRLSLPPLCDVDHLGWEFGLPEDGCRLPWSGW